MDNGKPEPSEGRPPKDLRADYVGHATDYASDQDRRWFEDHPGSTEYFRRAIDGEFGQGIYAPDSRVRVVLLGPGTRSRQVVRGVTITDPEMVRASESGEIATLPQELQKAIEEAARRVRSVHIRVAPGFDGATWLDLGRTNGMSVRIHPSGWDIVVPDPREVCWRRTQLTGELPLPVKDTDGKGIDLLFRLCNFANASSECLALAWLVGCLGPSVPVPAPFLTGPQGAGKSTAGRMLMRIIEGMSGDLRRPPKDEENLLAAVAAGWITALDNLSHMTPDMSDAMCCIVTGAENVKRALFTDGDVFRVGYRQPLMLTGIDVGVIRPDLAERLLPLRLERPTVRRTEAELWAEYAPVLPIMLGSLLDLAVKVRAAEAETPTDLRMADFAHLCAQLDAATGLGALAAYRASLDDLNDDVIEGDLLAQTVLQHAETVAPGTAQRMTSTEWLACLSRVYAGDELRALPKGWPTTGKVLSYRLKRLQPTLAARGLLIDTGRTKAGRYLEMTRPAPKPPQERVPLF